MAKRNNGLSITVGGEKELLRSIALLRKGFPEWLAAANMQTAEAIERRAEQNLLDIDAYDTGELYDKVRIKTARNGLSVVVGSTAKHAPYIEFGTRPHFPPLDKIRAWCIRKGIDPGAAYPIAKKIAKYGTPPRPWLYPAYNFEKRFHVDRVRSLVWRALSGTLRRAG